MSRSAFKEYTMRIASLLAALAATLFATSAFAATPQHTHGKTKAHAHKTHHAKAHAHAHAK